MILARRLLSVPVSRQLSTTLWDRRIDDFTPVHISSTSAVHVSQYDWREDCIAPRTKLHLPASHAEVYLGEDQLEIRSTHTTEKITAEIPLKSPLSITTTGAAEITVQGHEADVTLRTEEGECELRSVKCSNTSITSKTGNVNLNAIVSNCVVMTKGDITARKIQGESATISSSTGNIRIGAIYSPESRIFGKHGDIAVESVHGSCKIVSEGGHVTVGSSQDNLHVVSRGGEVHVTLHDIDREVLVESYGGRVRLGLSEGVCAKCMLTVRSSQTARVEREVQELVDRNEDARAVVGVVVHGAPVSVTLAKSWGEGIWDKLKKLE